MLGFTAAGLAALKASGGTLAVSWMNLGEYATVTDREQRLEAERLLDRLLPHIFPIDVDPGRVSERERAGNPYPHADLEIAKLFVKKRTVTTANKWPARIRIGVQSHYWARCESAIRT